MSARHPFDLSRARPRTLLHPSRWLLLSLLATSVLLAGCTVDPRNGTTFSGPIQGRTLHFGGFADTPAATITVEVLDPPGQDPRGVFSTWRVLAETSAAAVAVNPDADDPVYPWQVEATVVATASDQYLWPEGGITQLRVRQDLIVLPTFDNDGCIAEHFLEPMRTILAACGSHDSGILTLVDTDPIFEPPYTRTEDGKLEDPFEDKFIKNKQHPGARASRYYSNVDAGPLDERFTFSGWLSVNGFDPQIYTQTVDIDANANQLDNGGGPDISLRSAVDEGPVPAVVDGATDATGLTSAPTLAAMLEDGNLLRSAQGATMDFTRLDADTATLADVLQQYESRVPGLFQPPLLQSQEFNDVLGLDTSVRDTLFIADRANALPELLDVTAIYRNAGDLGFGREMHCRQKEDGGAACFVTNYGDVDTPAEESLADAIAHHDPVATVAMEYVPSAARNKVRFYVYGADGERALSAELDSEGLKSVPGVCLTCHQGEYDAATHDVDGARFLPFDIASFDYSSEPGYSRAEQEEAFRKLNRIVRDTNATDAIIDLIDGWYGQRNVYAPGTPFDEDYVPEGWASKAVVYEQAIKPYCRSCHVAIDNDVELNFMSADDVDARADRIKAVVCDVKTMPQAEVTYYKFWESSARAHLVGPLGYGTTCESVQP